MEKLHYRNTYEIEREILRLCKTPQKKTHIMYSVKLSYPQLVRYMYIVFLERELLNYNMTTKTYRTNSKGLERLRRLELI